MSKPLFYIYRCDAPGCDMEYAAKEQPLSCPYCDKGALYDEPTRVISRMITDELEDEQ